MKEEEEEVKGPGKEDSRPATAGCKGKLPRLAGGGGKTIQEQEEEGEKEEEQEEPHP